MPTRPARPGPGVVDFQDLLVLARDLLRDRADVRGHGSRTASASCSSTSCRTPTRCRWNWSSCSAGRGSNTGKLFAVGDPSSRSTASAGPRWPCSRTCGRTVRDEGRPALTLNFRSQPAILRLRQRACSLRFPELRAARRPSPARSSRRPVRRVPVWSPGRSEARKEPGPTWRPRGGRASPAGSPMMPHRDARSWIATGSRGRWSARRRRAAVPLDEQRGTLRGGPAAARARLLPRRRAGVLRPAGGVRPAQPAPGAGEPAGRGRPRRDAAIAVLLPERRGPVPCSPATRDGLWAGLHDDATVAACRTTSGRARRAGPRGSSTRWRAAQGPAADRPAARRRSSPTAATTRRMQFEFLGDRKLANLWKLIDLARDVRPHRPVRAGRVHRPARRTGRPPAARGAGRDAAGERRRRRLMSIHQAKGLEFPVVFVPDLAAPDRAAAPPRRPVGPRGSAAWPARRRGRPPLFTDFARPDSGGGRGRRRLAGRLAHPVRRLHARRETCSSCRPG